MTKETENTRASRTRVVTVDSQIQALVLKKALNDFIAGIEGSSQADGLLLPEDIINAAEELLDRVEALSFFQTVARTPRTTKPAVAAKPKTYEDKSAAAVAAK